MLHALALHVQPYAPTCFSLFIVTNNTVEWCQHQARVMIYCWSQGHGLLPNEAVALALWHPPKRAVTLESTLLLLLHSFAAPCMLSCCMVLVVDLHAMQVGEIVRRGRADAGLSFSHSCSYEGVYAADTAWCPGAPACCSLW